ncbi:GAF domain-containing protein [Niabella aurantiaca]|uniref:GAF domain-containing protein n=1 Tax=Niabella aurantiaca TaxID=379900 RepID=UPI000367E9CC|nr:GAF domain-containing protein [Niabella aurantiaca]
MAEDLSIHSGSKEEQYRSLLPQIRALLEGEPDLIANLSNIAAALKEQFNWWWVGFYLVKNDELVLGPFQGPVACTRIRKGRGVCGTAWEKAETLIVADVEQFPGHIACSSRSRSEIVVPIIRNGEVLGVLDADSEIQDHFSTTDQLHLEALLNSISFHLL